MMADSGDRVEDHVEVLDDQESRQPDQSHSQGQGEDEHQHKDKSPGGDPIHNDEAHLDPTRWWFASSAFPMVAGTLGPVASAFSICALVRPWRQKFAPGSDIDKAPFIADPIWLTVINAIQLAVAVVANLVLLMNMARKIRFSVAQPVTIVAWYFSSICLLALSATAAGPLHKEPESLYIWSQAFYYGIYAACLYFVCSSLMVVTFRGALKGHYPRDFQLTTSQRTLMLQTIMFLVYLLVGALVFSTIEGWSYLDAVYWADATLFTVGFGDYSAATPLGRALLFPYALIGVISLGLVVGSIRSLVLERGRRQLGARMEEKERKRTLKRRVRSGKGDILIPVQDDEQDYADSPGRIKTEYERRRREFELMRRIQIRAEHRRRWMAMGISTTAWLILWLVGAAIFQQCEVEYQGWTYYNGFYFAFVSLITIGYGDVTPISPAGKSFFVIWSMLALPTMTVLISNAGDTVVKAVREITDQLGTVTILPDERGVRKGLKELAKSLSMGQVFGDDSDFEASPPGGLGFAEEHNVSDDSEDEERGVATRARKLLSAKLDREIHDLADTARARKEGGSRSGKAMAEDISPTDPANPSSITIQRPASSSTKSNNQASLRKSTQRPPSPTKRKPTINSSDKKLSGSRSQNDVEAQTVKLGRAVSVPRSPSDMPREVPTDPHDYHLVLIDEISRVTQHIRTQPPRKYSFAEWDWYLKLIGEDERSAQRHQKAVPPDRKKKLGRGGDGEETPDKEDQDELQWSWVGSRSPLMGSQEEAEWILEELEKRLSKELRLVRDEARKR